MRPQASVLALPGHAAFRPYNQSRRELQMNAQDIYARDRSATGSILIAALSLLSFYTLALSSLPRFEHYLGVDFALSPLIIVFFALMFFPVIHRSGFPPAFFGICFDNWKSAVIFFFGGIASVYRRRRFFEMGCYLELAVACWDGSFKLRRCQCGGDERSHDIALVLVRGEPLPFLDTGPRVCCALLRSGAALRQFAGQ
jgi:hypothetical protein